MTKNMGSIDRGLRMVVAIVLAVLYYLGIIDGTLGIVALVVAVIFVVTSFVSFCPLYLPLGISTRAKK